MPDAFLVVLTILLTTAILVGLPCLLVRPLFLAIADRISGKHGSSRQLGIMEAKIAELEAETRALRVQIIHMEQEQSFNSKLLQDLQQEQKKQDCCEA